MLLVSLHRCLSGPARTLLLQGSLLCRMSTAPMAA